MTWKLYASARSPFVRKVLVAAHELGVADRFDRIDVNTNPMNPAPELLPVNPVGMIPVLAIDGEMIFDSFVILEFLGEAAGNRLFPAGAARRECLVRHAVANAMSDKAVRILDEKFREQNDDTRVHRDGYVSSIMRGIEWSGSRVKPNRFDAGDIALATVVSYLDFRFAEIDWRSASRPLADWYEDVAKRPSMLATPYVPPSPPPK
ncbi:MAG: glutathione S-transferase [Notoacmeibacter sp.]|nr:glutathione S-transferase [Notoacmeibacter sp.]